ncbi:hypothetical protein GR160_02935 [Flavobacterium sp. Sd200]|uniref:hypothetical protein n=1 Tax=Flavobacterium sp. Sd200 TaxID=2692211 RepID=UPI00136EBB61|nr:hypothetical protein [Flavobacterium sp. Sd200]MXN90169.1 hypothetical protein [Flavobacterium sp. Sd200]
MRKQSSKLFEDSIMYSIVQINDPEIGWVEEYRFEIYQRPYFFGLLGKKRWEFVIQTNDFNLGYSFCKSQL